MWLQGLGGRDVAGRDLVLVGGEGCQDFGLLALWNLGEVQGASEFCREPTLLIVNFECTLVRPGLQDHPDAQWTG